VTRTGSERPDRRREHPLCLILRVLDLIEDAGNVGVERRSVLRPPADAGSNVVIGSPKFAAVTASTANASRASEKTSSTQTASAPSARILRPGPNVLPWRSEHLPIRHQPPRLIR